MNTLPAQSPSGDNRRKFLGKLALGGAAAGMLGGAGARAVAAEKPKSGGTGSFRFSLNTSTIRGQKLGLKGELELAAKVGYDAVEPWVNSISDFKNSGGSLKDLKKEIEDLGLTIEGAIAFPEWIVDNDQQRAKGLEQARKDMDLIRQIGGLRIACPPSGATNGASLDLDAAGQRYRALLELGDEMGVVPEVELWGFSKNLHLVSQVAYVAIAAAHPKACILPDVYHLHRGGSDFEGLRLLSANAIHVIHMNDYPEHPDREKLNDSDRIYPGDGIVPWKTLIPELRAINPNMVLSLELFSQKLWQQPAEQVARTGLEKMKALVAANL